MCGIFGITKEEADLSGALSVLSHRGPDDRGEWKDGGVALCQNRLSIIDLSNGGHQPMLNDFGNVAIVFNGEIYNYADLRKELESVGVNFKSKSDTEVILKGFEKYGKAFFSRLRGMWAVGIFDKDKKMLTLSRDQFGIKPLFYSFIKEGVVFSSEVKAITSHIPKSSPDKENYFLFYNFGYFPGDLTSFKEIKKILPGEILSFNTETNNVVERDFVGLDSDTGGIDNIESAVACIKDAVLDSVEKHFISDVPVGLLLSGGNDSSLIASVSKYLGKNPTCFNVSIEGSLDNNYAERVALHLNLPYEKIAIKQKEFSDQYEEIWDILDQPTSDVSFIPTSLVYKSIKGKSKVVLSGEGGDEMFGGYLRHKKFSKYNEIEFNNFVPDFSFISKNSLNIVNPIMSRIRIMSPFESLGSTYLYNTRQIDLGIKQKEVLDFMENYYKNHPYKKIIQPNLFFDLFMYIPGSLMYKGDMSSMAYGIEGRVPFLDKEFFLNSSKISPRLRLSKDFEDKKIMKMVLEKFLPKDIVYRKKTGFGINIGGYGSFVLDDLVKAIKFHSENGNQLGIIDSGLDSILVPENAGVLLKKYPRFAFALISNSKIMQKFSK